MGMSLAQELSDIIQGADERERELEQKIENSENNDKISTQLEA